MFDKLLQPLANKLMEGEPKCMWTEEIALETLKFAIKWIFKYAMVFIVGVIVGAFGMWYHDKGEIDALQQELINVQAMYSDEQLAKEQALADLALEKQKEPEKVYIQGETKTETVYIEKESPDDADVEISNPPPTIKLAYNGKEEVLEMQTTKENMTKEDGKLVVNQASEIKIDVTDIANREIANIILQKDSEIEKLNHELKVKEREKWQQTAWSAVGGIIIGSIAS